MEASSSTDRTFCLNGRQLPALFVVGAQKCGTTSFVYQLFNEWGFAQGHAFNDGKFSDNKEHHFFGDTERVAKGLAHYASSFPACGSGGHAVATVDGTPNYFLSQRAAQDLARLYGPWRLQRTTFAFLLCDPVQRAQSSFYHFRRYGGSPRALCLRHTSHLPLPLRAAPTS